jgi:hypothetical protein
MSLDEERHIVTSIITPSTNTKTIVKPPIDPLPVDIETLPAGDSDTGDEIPPLVEDYIHPGPINITMADLVSPISMFGFVVFTMLFS